MLLTSSESTCYPPVHQSPESLKVVVAGAVNMDLAGTPFDSLRPGDSNPGKTALSPGGVGRNIAENLARLGLSVSLLTIFGRDHYGNLIQEHCRQTGIDLSLAIQDPDYPTSTYLCINEPNGDLHIAVSDMRICERLVPSLLSDALPVLNRSDLVILDANLPAETVSWLARRITVPLAADPVSVAKSFRLKSILPRITLMKPNLAEAEALTGISVRHDNDLHRIADYFLNLGVQQVFLSMGEKGVLACDASQQIHLPCFQSPVHNTTGCGDAFLAAVCKAYLQKEPLITAARTGLAAAALCAQDSGAVCPSLSPGTLSRFLEKHMHE